MTQCSSYCPLLSHLLFASLALILTLTPPLSLSDDSRNAALGHNDSDDRAFPEQVLIRPKSNPKSDSQGQSLRLKLKSAAVKEVVMARLHTGAFFGFCLVSWTYATALWSHVYDLRIFKPIGTNTVLIGPLLCSHRYG